MPHGSQQCLSDVFNAVLLLWIVYIHSNGMLYSAEYNKKGEGKCAELVLKVHYVTFNLVDMVGT